MKKMLPTLSRYWLVPILVLTMLFLKLPTAGSAQSTLVLLSPTDTEVDVGDTTTVNIRIENVSGLYGAEVHLSFDPALLEVEDADDDMAGVQIQTGSFLSPDFTAQNRVDLTAGTIDFSIAQMGTGAVSGSGTLATITFKGKASGTSNINFSNVILSNQGGGEISAGTQNGSVTVQDDSPTPTETPVPDPTDTPAPNPTETPAPNPTETPAPNPTETPAPNDILGYHTVRPGETLYCIARAYGVDPYAIAEENGIVTPSYIYAGQSLAIPNVPKTLPAGPVCPRQFDGGDDDGDCRWYHTVARGENLYRISLRYNVSMYAIAEANNITNLNLIHAGDVLCIP